MGLEISPSYIRIVRPTNVLLELNRTTHTLMKVALEYLRHRGAHDWWDSRLRVGASRVSTLHAIDKLHVLLSETLTERRVLLDLIDRKTT